MVTLRVAGITRESVVDGPGIRVVVFTQGCPRHCKGCHNPELIPREGGREMTVEQLVEEIGKCVSSLTRGVTFSGGDPLLQAEALEETIKLLRKRYPHLDIWVYSGYRFEEIKDLPLLRYVDALVDGPFIEEEKDLTLPFRGSRNQRIIDLWQTFQRGEVVELKWSADGILFCSEKVKKRGKRS